MRPDSCVLVCLSFIARKRSLGQGNVFTTVCHSVHRQGSASRGVCIQGGGGSLHAGRVYIQSDTTGYTQRADGTHPSGMHSCFLWIYMPLDLNLCIILSISSTGELTWVFRSVGKISEELCWFDNGKAAAKWNKYSKYSAFCLARIIDVFWANESNRNSNQPQ